MTYPEGKIRIEGEWNGSSLRVGLLKANDCDVEDAGEERRLRGRRWGSSPIWWAKIAFACLLLAAAGVAFFVWGVPFFLNKIVVPTLEWERRTFSAPVLVLLIFVSIAVCPALLIPSSPSMWVAGITFGYGYGFLLIMAGASVGMSLPFIIGSLFQHKLHKVLERWPKQAAVMRLAGEGDWFHQFRAVTLLRISPFPYIVFNYAAVATNVKYCPYIIGSLVGIIPETFITIYSGILIQSLAEMSGRRGFPSVQQIIYDVIGFCIALAATTAITVYAKRTLQTLQAEDELA